MAEGELFERRDPARTEHVASRAHEAGPELVRRAVEAARAAAPGWAATEYRERCRLLRAVADGIGERHMELAALASLETGKSRTESILEVQEAIDLIEAYAGHMEENEGYTQPLNSFVEGERNVDVLRPVRRVRRDRAVQLPGGAVRGNVQLGADRRQHRGLQAVRGVALDGCRRSQRSCRPPGFRPVPSTSFRAGPTPAVRSWTRPSTALRSPAPPRWGARSPARCRRARTRAPR